MKGAGKTKITTPYSEKGRTRKKIKTYNANYNVIQKDRYITIKHGTRKKNYNDYRFKIKRQSPPDIVMTYGVKDDVELPEGNACVTHSIINGHSLGVLNTLKNYTTPKRIFIVASHGVISPLIHNVPKNTFLFNSGGICSIVNVFFLKNLLKTFDKKTGMKILDIYFGLYGPYGEGVSKESTIYGFNKFFLPYELAPVKYLSYTKEELGYNPFGIYEHRVGITNIKDALVKNLTLETGESVNVDDIFFKGTTSYDIMNNINRTYKDTVNFIFYVSCSAVHRVINEVVYAPVTTILMDNMFYLKDTNTSRISKRHIIAPAYKIPGIHSSTRNDREIYRESEMPYMNYSFLFNSIGGNSNGGNSNGGNSNGGNGKNKGNTCPINNIQEVYAAYKKLILEKGERGTHVLVFDIMYKGKSPKPNSLLLEDFIEIYVLDHSRLKGSVFKYPSEVEAFIMEQLREHKEPNIPQNEINALPEYENIVGESNTIETQ
jgi:hypothetical protein